LLFFSAFFCWNKERIKYFKGKKTSIEDPNRIWTFAPEQSPTNVMINETSGIQYLHEVRDSICNGFINTSLAGPLCEEPLRGVRINIKDALFHSDNVHRGGDQIIPMTNNGVYASILSAKPRLLEPIFTAEITVPREKVSSIYSVMAKRRGQITSVNPEMNNVMMNVSAFLPVAESFGFIEQLREETSGMAFANLLFSHWQIVPGDPLEEGSYANKIMLGIRKRKGRKVETPMLNDYLDKL